MTPQEAVVLVESASAADSLKGSTQRDLRILLHPDRFGRDAAWAKRAEAATFKLDSLFSDSTPTPVSAVKLGKWVVTAPLAKGDLADLHIAESTEGDRTQSVLKIAQSARDNDLMDAEREALKKLWTNPGVHYSQYTTQLLDSFNASGRRVNVIQHAKDFISLKQIIATGIQLDFRHIVWMMNRALSLLGYVHGQGLVHGAITPEHLLYCPMNHNLCLVDWCYSSTGSPVKSVAESYRSLYPAEVLRKQPPSPATDLFMLAGSLRSAAHAPTAHPRMWSLLELCLTASPHSRPESAWEFQDKWKDAAEAVYGPPRFLSLVLPGTTAS